MKKEKNKVKIVRPKTEQKSDDQPRQAKRNGISYQVGIGK
jgi:hypothetical protein